MAKRRISAAALRFIVQLAFLFGGFCVFAALGGLPGAIAGGAVCVGGLGLGHLLFRRRATPEEMQADQRYRRGSGK